ncbi:ACT domain-containing protein [Propionivibrio soli]|uniref:ACT domain-containing protein n=1 Tax=Propionivibrio soli TaxID=2976531 RepID=UPI0021E9A1B4|nr:ACT domain-containing protein [Propionivibrio soli]
MVPAVSDLNELLRSMEPLLHEGVYVYCVVADDVILGQLSPVATVRESEGTTLILAADEAQRAGLTAVFRARWITLQVHSDLQAVGLTAAFAGALGAAGISCNVVAGAHHDHLFVPETQAERAIDVLRELQRTA